MDRESWAHGVYANFDLAGCIALETAALDEAATKDPVFARLLSINVARRSARLNGEEHWAPYGDLLALAEDIERNPGSDEDLLLASIAVRSVACVAARLDGWASAMGVAVEETQDKKAHLFRRARALQQAVPETDSWVSREVGASLGVAEINEEAERHDAVSERYEEHVGVFGDYTPAFFDRANHRRMCYAAGLGTVDRDAVLAAYADAVSVAQGWERTPQLLLATSIQAAVRDSRASGRALAERQLALAANVLENAPARELNALEHDRFLAAMHG